MQLDINPTINHQGALLREELYKLIQPRHSSYKEHFMGQMIHEANNSDLWWGFRLPGVETDAVKECAIALRVGRLLTKPGPAPVFVRELRAAAESTASTALSGREFRHGLLLAV